MKTKLLIFGITGDLGTHKLLPALEQIISTGDFEDLSVIGVSRHVIKPDILFDFCKDKTFLDNKLSLFTMDLDNPDDYLKLKQFIRLTDDQQLLIYLAVPPAATNQIVQQMGSAGLNTPNVKILFEKPFGTDLASAKGLITQTARYYQEKQIYRIDHYLAKEMSQNLVALRGRNALFSDIWNNQFIDSIDIIATEKNGIEGRVQFYEQTGALRDLVQGHLIQLLALTIMDIPPDFDWDKMPQLRLLALNQLQPADPEKTIRAQYTGYKTEVENPASEVETFVSLSLTSAQPQWLGVPIRLTTGKNLDKSTTEIQIHLKKVNEANSNRLIFRIQPNEGVDIELFSKKPGYSYNRAFETRHLSFNYSADAKLPEAYEQVIVDAILSRKSLFTSSDEVLQSWRILQPIQDNWIKTHNQIKQYPKNSDIDTVLA
jgi:glucose-6-phosphate 1-dehydrogenase